MNSYLRRSRYSSVILSLFSYSFSTWRIEGCVESLSAARDRFVIGRQTNLQRDEANISRRGRRKLKERETPVQRVMKYDMDTRILAENLHET